ncbi:hypothetical protein HNQ80_002197 [Anaerosolibacter carboniphilus]|uniref:GIY-YIG nuclease family protein n=1 Tax=Anaerosolibacter carboniphilus TaxID=1417629 RepID=A0A841KV67_9FIRM|nr:GIY-YIG nuclease family protein [Anaerosolibacter carboniphilus]MBB6216098.1 hypothetical protein [Anaerosolibacter carboniphilus]
MNRKKELKEQYKQMRHEMGIFIIRSKVNNKCYIEATQDLRGTMNGTRFKLGAGAHPNRQLQKEWKEFGEGNFTIEILENLEYDKDESKTDYKEDLALLRMIWEEKLLKQKLEFYER